ncbi:MAG: DUF1501 domain-containing protein [Planctomycetaceae bacterium]|nr:DUF1501 domain-containing protein [Planctomycetaceae bacterium]MCB9950140.1 DUF1501 domain-containing protein [Planctomycetaceae bacterium]
MLNNLSRRDVLRHAVTGALGLGAAPLLAGTNPLAPQPSQFAAKAKRVILFFMPGGVSHVDSFDPKQALKKDDGKEVGKDRVLTGSMWGSKQYGESGLEISDLFPFTAQCADDLCLLRSLHGDKGDHFEATLSMHSGAMAGTLPGIGAWVSYGMGTQNPNLPSHVVFAEKLPYAGSQSWDSNFLPAYHQGTRIKPGAEPIANLNPDPLTASQQSRELDLLARMNARHRDGRPGDEVLDARMYSFEAALGLQQTAPEVFNLADETQATLDLYGIDGNDSKSFAWQCLMARRMSEQGVRFIEIVDKGNWDAHSNMKSYEKLSKNVDRGMGALITDLKQRGLFEETLIVWCTEFGRTPSAKKSATDGRDHYKDAFTCWLAGGGVKGGMAYGATDEHGIGIVENPVHIHDFHATILHLLGFDHTKLTYFYSGRDFRLTGLWGNVVTDIIA